MVEILATINNENNIGYEGENESRALLFPIAELREKFPNATFSLVHQRNGDEHPYPCTVSTDDNHLRWIINNSDVAKIGIGEAQLILAEGNKILKSIRYKTKTNKSLGDTTEVPPPYQPWVDSVLKEFAFSHKLENITCHYVSIPHSAEPHCDSEETETGLILTFYIPMGADGKDGKDGEKGEKGDTYELTEEDKEEIASKVHYDDSELREMIDEKASIIMLHSELSNGTWTIKNADGNTLTYADIKALHNKEDYIVCLHQNVIHSTSFLTDAIEFMGTYYINDNGYISRLIINDANVVKADGYALENAENKLDDIEGYEVGDVPNSYPSTDAIVPQLNKKAEVFVAEYGVTTYNEVKNAYESGKHIVCIREVNGGESIYNLSHYSPALNRFYFGCFQNNSLSYVYVITNNTWNNNGVIVNTAIKNNAQDYYVPTSKAVADYVADGENLPKASATEYGGIKVTSWYGADISSDAGLYISKARDVDIDGRTQNYKPITSTNLDYAVKSALCDGKGQAYTEAEKKSARERIGMSDTDIKNLMDSIYPILDEVAL